jgi:hypothetical protein
MTPDLKAIVVQLCSLKEHFHVCGIKAEYETEGTRRDELAVLKELSLRAGLDLTLKTGGCSSVRDLIDARVFGVKRIVSPMIESAFALSKFRQSYERAYGSDDSAECFINVETVGCINCIEEVLSSRDACFLSGIVIGRTDLTGSMGLDSSSTVNGPDVLCLARKAATAAKSHGFDCVVGGKVTAASEPFLDDLYSSGLLDRFETRKVIFDANGALRSDLNRCIEEALRFEMMWMTYKRSYYSAISSEDASRIADIRKRITM